MPTIITVKRLLLIVLLGYLVPIRAELPEKVMQRKEAAVQKARDGQSAEALKILAAISLRHPQDEGVIHDQIIILSESGKNREALELFEKLKPSKIPAHLARAVVNACRELKRTELALKLVAAQLEQHPEEIEWQIRRAQLLLDKADYKIASQLLQDFNQKDRQHPDWLNLRILAALGEEDWSAVVDYNQQRIEAQQQPDLELIKIQIDALLHLKDHEKALPLLTAARQRFPSDTGLMQDRLVLLSLQGENAEALALINKINPQTAPDWVIQAAVEVARQQQKPDLALQLIDTRLTNKPKSAEWQIRRVQLLLDKGEGQQAAKELDQLDKTAQQHPDWLNLRIQAARDSQDWTGVVRYNQQNIDRQPEASLQTLKLQADAWLHLENYPKALAIIESLGKQFPQDVGLTQDRAVLLARTGRNREALLIIKTIDAKEAPDYVIRTAITTCRELKETELALKLVAAKISQQPRNAEWKIRRAQLLVDLGKAGQAAKELEKIRETRHQYPDWYDVRIYAAQVTEDWMSVLRYSQEKLEKLNQPDLSVLGLKVDALIHLGAAHAAEHILDKYPELRNNKRKLDVTDRLTAVDLHWSGYAALTMEERIQRAEAVIDRLAKYSAPTTLPRKLASLKVIALHNANRWQEATELYEDLEEHDKLPSYVTIAIAGSYLALKQPDLAHELYQQMWEAGFKDEEVSSGLFYSLVEEENFTDAYELIDGLAREEPVWRSYVGTPSPVENGRELDLVMMGINARYFADQLSKSWNWIDQLEQAAPSNNWIREMHANIALARNWRHQALAEFKTAAAINPESTAALTGIASSQLQMGAFKEAEANLLDLETKYPQTPTVKQLRKDWDVYQMAELWSDFQYNHSNGPELNGAGILATSELYGSPFAYNWRPVLQGRYAWGEILEGETYLAYIGVGAEYRSPNWELLASGGYVQSLLKDTASGNLRATWFPQDQWTLSGEYSTFDLDMPLRALWYGITADRIGASLSYRWHESRLFRVSLARSNFTDDNERWMADASLRQRLIDIPHLDVDAILSVYGSQNSSRNAPYFNPEQDLASALGLDTEHILWRSYDRTWVQHITCQLGWYDQKNYASDWTGRIGYEQRLTLYPDWELVAGINAGRRVYDGHPEPFFGFNFLIHARF